MVGSRSEHTEANNPLAMLVWLVLSYWPYEEERKAGESSFRSKSTRTSIEVPSNATFCFAVYSATGGGKVQVCQIIKGFTSYYTYNARVLRADKYKRGSFLFHIGPSWTANNFLRRHY